MTTMPVVAACFTVAADTSWPSAETPEVSDSGPRLLAITTERPARSAVRAIACPRRPAPIIPTRLWFAGSIGFLSRIESPDPHPAIDDDVDPGHVRTLVRGQEQRDVRDFLRPAEATQQRLPEHVARPLGVVELLSRGVALDHAGRDRVGANPVLPALHRQLSCHPDEPRLVRRVGERGEDLE